MCLTCRPRLGRISRLGHKYIRQLLIVGAQTALLRSKLARSNAWIQGLLARRPRLVVAVALANKTARIVWGDDGERAELPAGRPGIARGRLPNDACEGRNVMLWSVAPTGQEQPEEVEGTTSRGSDEAQARGTHRGQRSCDDRVNRPDT
jgi:hypothetical protein